MKPKKDGGITELVWAEQRELPEVHQKVRRKKKSRLEKKLKKIRRQARQTN
jgi:hypothetical protein